MHSTGVLLQVPCKDCECIYTGEMERRKGVSEKEHKRDVKTLEEKKYTRSLMEVHPLAIMDHIVKENHTIDWEDVKLPVRDTDWIDRGVKEVIMIRKTGAHTMNRYGGTTN